MTNLCCLLNVDISCALCGGSWCSSHEIRHEAHHRPSPADHYIGCLEDKRPYYFCPSKQLLVSYFNGEFDYLAVMGNRPASLLPLLIKENEKDPRNKL